MSHSLLKADNMDKQHVKNDNNTNNTKFYPRNRMFKIGNHQGDLANVGEKIVSAIAYI